jgi:hypothetical protein
MVCINICLEMSGFWSLIERIPLTINTLICNILLTTGIVHIQYTYGTHTVHIQYIYSTYTVHVPNLNSYCLPSHNLHQMLGMPYTRINTHTDTSDHGQLHLFKGPGSFLVNKTNRRIEFQFYWYYDSVFRAVFLPVIRSS